MPRPRIPAFYGIFQFCVRLMVVVIEVCALAALVILSRYNDNFAIGYVAVILGILFCMAEMVTLANSTHQIPRLRSSFIILADLVLCVLGMVSFFYVMIRRGWRPQEGRQWASEDPFRDDKAIWSPWYTWLQLTAAILHVVCMVMHCIDSCRRSGRESRRRRRNRRGERARAMERGQEMGQGREMEQGQEMGQGQGQEQEQQQGDSALEGQGTREETTRGTDGEPTRSRWWRPSS